MLYSLFIYFIYRCILFYSIFNSKAKLWINGRKNIWANLFQNIDTKSDWIWFHAASLGEFEQGRPLIEEFKLKYPKIKILLTFFSPSGYEIRKNYQFADYVSYLPIDTKKNARLFIKQVSPKAIFFIKYEFWKNYLEEAKKKNIPIFLVSGIFRKNQFFFHPLGSWFRNLLDNFSMLFVQNHESLTLLQQIGKKNICIAPDTRFDRVHTIAQNTKEIPLISEFSNNIPIIVCGSTWAEDERIIIQYINQTTLNLKFIIVPHEIHKSNIDRIVSSLNKNTVKYSEANVSSISKYNVLIIDNIGMLSAIYRYAFVAYIGGGFGKGIHNVLEAATYSLPVIFGRNYSKFKEAVDLVRNDAAFCIKNYTEFYTLLTELLQNRDKYTKASSEAGKYIEENSGGTKIIMEKLEEFRIFG